MMSKQELDYGAIETYLTAKKYPTVLKGNSGKKTNFKRIASNFATHGGVLYRHFGQARTLLRVIKEKEERVKIVQATHEGLGQTLEARSLGGHVGQDKTELKIMERFWWPNVRRDVRSFVSACEQCKKSASRFQKSAPEVHPIAFPPHPWKEIGVDLYSLTESHDGFKYIIVVVDYNTKWLEAEPLKYKNAESVAQFLYQLICRHGFTEVQINDQDQEFVNRVYDRLHSLTGVKQQMTSAYHPQANRLTERNNWTIQNSLLKLLSDSDGDETTSNKDWPRALPGILFGLRTSQQATTGYSPFYLMYGRQPKLPLNGMVSCPVSSDEIKEEVTK